MGFYARYVLPRLTHLSMQQAQLRAYRERGRRRDRAREIGSARPNLPYYPETVDGQGRTRPGMLALALQRSLPA
jgi:hypothetical protein